MAKKKSARKPGGAAGIATFEEVRDPGEIEAADDIATEMDDSPAEVAPAKRAPKKQPKAKDEASSSSGQVGVGDIRKAAAFVNAVGGLDKAMSLLQILKVAKEVQ